jgi:hypothetical protein
LVGAQGLTPEGFEANVRRELSVSQVMGGVMSTAFATDAAAKLALDSLYQRREIQVARFNATDYAKQVNPTEADHREPSTRPMPSVSSSKSKLPWNMSFSTWTACARASV